MTKQRSQKRSASLSVEDVDAGRGGGDGASKALGLAFNDFVEISRFLVTSGITLAALKGLIQIIVKLIENEGKKSVTIKLPDREISVQGTSADELMKIVEEILKDQPGDFQIEVKSKQTPASRVDHM